MCCANFVLKHNRKDQNESNRLDEIKIPLRLVYQEKTWKPDAKEGVTDFYLFGLITQRSKVQILPPQPTVSPTSTSSFFSSLLSRAILSVFLSVFS